MQNKGMVSTLLVVLFAASSLNASQQPSLSAKVNTVVSNGYSSAKQAYNSETTNQVVKAGACVLIAKGVYDLGFYAYTKYNTRKVTRGGNNAEVGGQKNANDKVAKKVAKKPSMLASLPLVGGYFGEPKTPRTLELEKLDRDCRAAKDAADALRKKRDGLDSDLKSLEEKLAEAQRNEDAIAAKHKKIAAKKKAELEKAQLEAKREAEVSSSSSSMSSSSSSEASSK